MRRAVITGAGCLSPNGNSRAEYWSALRGGRSGIAAVTLFDASSLPVRIAGEVKGIDLFAELRPKEREHVSRVVPLALRAAREALADAGIVPAAMGLGELRRAGVFVGTGGGGLEFTERQYGYYYSGEHKKASVYTIANSTPGTLSSELSIAFGFRGPSHVISTGCTSSTDAIGYAAQAIIYNRIDLALAGGVDAPIAPGIMAGFCLMRALTASWNHDPPRASRPFNIDRDGFVLSEGAWFFVLEEQERARARGARLYAEVAGYASTCDAYHRVRPDESGEEPARAVALAVEEAGLDSTAIDYVNLHGTSTLLNDRIETRAMKLYFGSRAHRIPMSATKSMIGHPQGACGAAGVAATLLAICEGVLPPTINLESPDPECDLDYVPEPGRRAEVRAAVCNCLSFGSKNSALVLKAVQ